MLRFIGWLFWFPEPFTDAEFDIEGRDVIGIERRWPVTVIWYRVPSKRGFKSVQDTVRCCLAKHNDFVQRFRNKLNNQTKTK